MLHDVPCDSRIGHSRACPVRSVDTALRRSALASQTHTRPATRRAPPLAARRACAPVAVDPRGDPKGVAPASPKERDLQTLILQNGLGVVGHLDEAGRDLRRALLRVDGRQRLEGAVREDIIQCRYPLYEGIVRLEAVALASKQSTHTNVRRA